MASTPKLPNFKQLSGLVTRRLYFKKKYDIKRPFFPPCRNWPICEHHFTRWTHPDISLPFRAGGRRLKNFRFSRNSIAARVFFLPACCGLNFDATDLPNSSFEPLYPKLFRGNPEVDLVSTVWPPDLPKVRWCPYSAAEKCCFRCFFLLNKFSRPNGRLWLPAFHTCLESYDTQL